MDLWVAVVGDTVAAPGEFSITVGRGLGWAILPSKALSALILASLCLQPGYFKKKYIFPFLRPLLMSPFLEALEEWRNIFIPIAPCLKAERQHQGLPGRYAF